MNVYKFSGVVIASADVMSWTSHVAGPVASAAHPVIATHDAIPATKRRNAAAPVASVNRGSI